MQTTDGSGNTDDTAGTLPVLVVGGGLVGLASTLFLAHHDVPALLVDRHPGVSIQGRARGINQRTMEIYRAFGVDAEIYEAGKPFDDEAGVARCTAISGEWEWVFEDEAPRAWPDLTAASYCMADQSSVEPILIEAAANRGAVHLFDTEVLSVQQDGDGVNALVENTKTGQQRTIRARYLIAADGHRSPIRESLGINRPGATIFQHSMNIVFRADLSPYIQRRALFWIILNPQAGIFGGMVSTSEPHRWQLTVGYDPQHQSIEDFTTEHCLGLVRAAIGVPDLAAEVEDIAAWEQGVGVAQKFRSDRIFLAGDSAHMWPPAAAMGANTGVQDAHNLAWKLAGVVRGWAKDALLDSYEAERRPLANELAPRIVANQQARMGGGDAEGETKPDDKVWALGHRYRSSAVLGTDLSMGQHDTVFGEKLDLHGQPGTRAPHLWLEFGGARIGLHDLCTDSFVLLTGRDGAPWYGAAAPVSDTLAVPLKAYRVGAQGEGVDLVDVEDEWQTRYGLGTGGAVLIRPDGYVAWRDERTVSDPAVTLTTVLRKVLGFDVS
ncbi:2-polyprenyl-6-methoxyphenol hydroxylase-like FAD-dependent oxidoreductase [Kibdelosporangium banguiense]|uniref:2-polyprenyl-6-methoxyphenol hydroxylase-like FAD-dependent oxidoreductase n=1 Tax=Kibdelosporangium banguiense TaxID=1365924 RepID=A0ABS4TS90_9PSEU|nr:FAD-dependent monooxygenase [Kibdelosporangium banguiense]MBP2327273.1 2-polyprenyl-6-methoxyphenol hydroxylase-like FAD-dependent oxidoreductase [Kibdelosporangium banguiense]